MMQTLLFFDRATYPRVIEALLQRAKGWVVILSTRLSDRKVDLASTSPRTTVASGRTPSAARQDPGSRSARMFS
jgi:hypothetical protein